MYVEHLWGKCSKIGISLFFYCYLGSLLLPSDAQIAAKSCGEEEEDGGGEEGEESASIHVSFHIH